jgi:Ca2+-binding RTX toxin-like protein
MYQRAAFTLALAVCSALSASAATYPVSSLADLQARIEAAVPGDTVILANGTYTSTASIPIRVQGTADLPITITAESVLGARIIGSAGFTFTSTAAYVVLRGFDLAHTAGTINLPSGSHHCHVTLNDIHLAVPAGVSRTFVTVNGNDHQFSYNTFRHKHTEGMMLSIQGPTSPAMAQRTWVHHNYFFDFTRSNANNSGALHIGHSSRSLTAAHSLVEYNLFVETNAENEGSITNKSSDNIYRYNTFGSRSEELSLRHGNRCEVYGNFFVGCVGGLRIFGDDHKIHSNYFEGCTRSLNIGNGDCTIPPGELTCHDQPVNVEIVNNTLVNNAGNIQMSGRTNGLGGDTIVIANNLIQGGPSAASIRGPLTNSTWEGNIIWNTAPGNMEGYTVVDPLLAEDSTSEFRLQPGSPAIDAGVGSYPNVTVDMDRQARIGLLDVGADEVSSEPIGNRILTTADVGPYSVAGVPAPTPDPVPTPTPTPVPTATPTPTPPPPGLLFEAEALPFVSTGAPTIVESDALASNRSWMSLLATAVGDAIDYPIAGVPRGTYDLYFQYKTNTNRGIHNLSVDGAVIGPEIDQYKTGSGTFPEVLMGTVRFDADGDHVVRLTVVGKRPEAATHRTSADRFRFLRDETAPVITVPERLTLEATGPAGAVATFSASAVDDKDGPVEVTLAPPSGSTFALGVTTVTATAADFNGNLATATFEVQVVDTTAPTLALPAPITVEATQAEGARVAFSAAATDLVDGAVPVALSHPTGGLFPLGTTTVGGVAVDRAGNRAEGAFTITVVDTTAPTLLAPPAITISTCAVPSLGQPTATDAVSTPVVTNDAPALFPLGVTVVTWRAVDAAGNASTATQEVTAVLGDDASCCPAGTNVIPGTSANDVLFGTFRADCILGRGGNDLILALHGNDFISGGDGNDVIDAGFGNDVVNGGPGIDTINAGLGDDVVSGGPATDVIAAGPGSDTVDGGPGFDVCAVPPDGTDVVKSCP